MCHPHQFSSITVNLWAARRLEKPVARHQLVFLLTMSRHKVFENNAGLSLHIAGHVPGKGHVKMHWYC